MNWKSQLAATSISLTQDSQTEENTPQEKKKREIEREREVLWLQTENIQSNVALIMTSSNCL